MSDDFYKAYKKVRKQMPPEGKVIIPDNEYDRHDKSWLNIDDEEDVDIYDFQGPDKADPEDHFNLAEWNRKFNEKPINPKLAK